MRGQSFVLSILYLPLKTAAQSIDSIVASPTSQIYLVQPRLKELIAIPNVLHKSTFCMQGKAKCMGCRLKTM